MNFQQHYQHIARPVQWTFTRQELAALLAKLTKEAPPQVA